MATNVSAKGRWQSPDPLGGDITNPQSLNRYAYVENNPETLTDPLGLDATGCTPATLPDGSQGLNCSGPDSVTVTGYWSGGFGGGGGDGAEPPLIFAPTMHPGPTRFCGPMQGCWWNKPAPPKPATTNDVPLNSFASAVFAKVYQNLNFLDPQPCGGGFFGFRGREGNVGVAKAGAYTTFNRDSQSGSSLGALVEGGVGPLSVGYETSVNPTSGKTDSSALVFLGTGIGAFGAFNRNQIQLGLYGSAGVVGGGPYINLVPSGTCNQ